MGAAVEKGKGAAPIKRRGKHRSPRPGEDAALKAVALHLNLKRPPKGEAAATKPARSARAAALVSLVVLHADFVHELEDVALAELEADADEGILFADVEDAEEGFDQFEVAREDVFHELLAGLGEGDDGDAAAAAGNVLERVMEVGALEFDGRESGGDLADPSQGGDAR